MSIGFAEIFCFWQIILGVSKTSETKLLKFNGSVRFVFPLKKTNRYDKMLQGATKKARDVYKMGHKKTKIDTFRYNVAQNCSELLFLFRWYMYYNYYTHHEKHSLN